MTTEKLAEGPPMRAIFNVLIERFYDIFMSVYIYNEHRGYLYLDTLVTALEQKYPEETGFIAAVRKHGNDEHVHYKMFRRWFENRGRMPFVITETSGYCDQIVKVFFRKTLTEIDPEVVLADDEMFFKLCRLIMITEMRALKQVDILLASRLIKSRPALLKMFQVVRRDEPSHCYPYRDWLAKHGENLPSRSESLADFYTHYSLIFFKIPLLYLNFRLKRTQHFLA